MDKRTELRLFYEGSLFEFAKYINPHYAYSDIHEEVFHWLENPDQHLNLLLLLPRGHLKSHCIAVYCAWRLAKVPWWTMVYLTAGDDLAQVQMASIKAMLTCDRFRLLWPTHVNLEESKREKWATREINLDHPTRKDRSIRDFSLIIKTLGSSATGLHCDELIIDDIVVPQNAYTEAGRKLVQQSVADFTSVKNTGAMTKACGTRYAGNDMYSAWIEAVYEVVNQETGEIIGTKKLWNVFEAVVEDSEEHDGTGTYLWPRIQSRNGSWYGWDQQILAIKKAEYIQAGERAQFYSQYYNDPNYGGDDAIGAEGFQYIRSRSLTKAGDHIYAFGRRLEVIAAMDCAWTDDTGLSRRKKGSDWTAIVVVGMDADGFYYVLDISIFRTSKFHEYYRKLINLHNIWKFRKVYIETNSAGRLIKQELDTQIKENGYNIITFGKNRGKNDGTKEERWAMILEPKYEAKLVYHRRCGYIHAMEDQLRKQRPKYDDIKDALTIALENIRKPKNWSRTIESSGTVKTANSRFGGRRG